MTDQSLDRTKVHLGESGSFTGVTCKNVAEALLSGVEMRQTQVRQHKPTSLSTVAVHES